MSNQFPPPSKAMMLLRCNDYWEVNKMKKKKHSEDKGQYENRIYE